MHEVILEHPTHLANGYYWYIERALRRLEEQGEIELAFVAADNDDAPDDVQRYVRVCWIDDEPRIIDLRDSHRLPLHTIAREPQAPVLKSSFSREYWACTTDVDFTAIKGMERNDLEQELVDEGRVLPIAFGRAMAAPFGANLREALRPTLTQERPFEVACLVGAGQTWQQTHYRLRLLELLRERFGAKARLAFFRPERCAESMKVPHFLTRAKCFEPTQQELKQVASLKGYYQWLSRAKVGVNVPGFCLSPPFRFVDGVLACTPTITTKVWADGYRRFPAPELPFCAFTGHGRWEWTLDAELTLEGLSAARTMQHLWYERWLTPRGILDQLIGGIK